MIESGPEYEKMAADAREVMAAVTYPGPFASCVGKEPTFEKTKEMLRMLQKCGMNRVDRKTSLIHMLNTPLGHSFGADAGRAWAVLQP